MKCPACGFETPEEQGWCDFCKEPFRKKKKEPEAPAKAAEASTTPPSPAPKKVSLPPGVLEKLTYEKLAMGKQLPPGIPPEFAVLDQGEKIPEVSGTYRKLAWVFLAMVLFFGLIFGTVIISKARHRAPRQQAAPSLIPVQVPPPSPPPPPPAAAD